MLADRYGRKKILAYCTLPIPFVMLIWPSVHNYTLLLILYMFIVGLWSMTWPSAVAYIMELTPTLERGSAISIRQVAVRLGFTVGPLIGGYLWDAYTPTAPFYASSVFFIVAFLLALFLKK